MCLAELSPIRGFVPRDQTATSQTGSRIRGRKYTDVLQIVVVFIAGDGEENGLYSSNFVWCACRKKIRFYVLVKWFKYLVVEVGLSSVFCQKRKVDTNPTGSCCKQMI